MTAERLKKVALGQFARHGYDGTSLASITNEIGMKKQSIYAHFKNKEDLFLSAFADSIEEELDFVNRFVKANSSTSSKELLHSFLHSYLNRYSESDNMSFFLRTSFFPPAQIELLVKDGTNAFITELEAVFLNVFQGDPKVLRQGISAESATSAYMTILDGMFVEMLYNGNPQRLEKKLIEVWQVYSLVFSHTNIAL